MCSVLNVSVCAFVCVCLRACVMWGNEFGRLSVAVGGLVPGPEKGQRGVRWFLEGAGEAGAPTVTASVPRLPELGLWDRRDAFVRLGRGHETRQTGALVRPLRVGAPPVLTQGHLVADVLALVYVCKKRRQDELVSGEISQLEQLPAPHLWRDTGMSK